MPPIISALLWTLAGAVIVAFLIIVIFLIVNLIISIMRSGDN